MYTPYTYLIGWSDINIWYYGVRYARNCSPNEFWSSYFTSSKYVKEQIVLSGQPNVIQIRKVFSTASDARKWEHTLLRRLNCVSKPNFLNKTDNKSIAPMPGVKRPGVGGVKKGTPCPIKGKKAYHNPETLHLIYLSENDSPLIGYIKGAPKKTPEHNLKNSAANTGKPKHTNEQKSKWSKERKGTNTGGNNYNARSILIEGVRYDSIKEACESLNKNPTHIRYYLKNGQFKETSKTCKHCNKTVSNSNYQRWHGPLCPLST